MQKGAESRLADEALLLIMTWPAVRLAVDEGVRADRPIRR
jgi:hypothetical protein